MREEIKNRRETIYVCEICGKSGLHKHIIEHCEKQCKCQHSNTKFVLEENNDYESDQYNWENISHVCSDCDYIIATIGLHLMEDDQDLLSDLYYKLRKKCRDRKRKRQADKLIRIKKKVRLKGGKTKFI